MAVVLCAPGAAFAVGRASASYSIAFEALTVGGGACASATYLQPDTAIGQETVHAYSVSPGFAEENGMVPAGFFVPVRLSRFSVE